MTIASGEINLQSKHNLICHVAKIKAAMSAHSMADIIPFFSVFSVFIVSLRIQCFDKTKRKYILHTNKENNIRNILVLMFQQLLANKHHGLHDSKFGREEVWVWSQTKKDKPRVEHEPRSAHGRMINYQQAYFRRSQGAWNKITTHFTKILIIIALTRNSGCTNFNRWGIFLSKKVKFEVLFTWPLLFYR